MVAFVVHNLVHAVAALDAAREGGVTATLRSPPSAAQSMGPLYFHAMIGEAFRRVGEVRAKAVLDCGDAPGLALAALREGVKALRLVASPEIMEKVSDIAARMGAAVWSPAEDVEPVLDLASCMADPRGAALAFIAGNTPGAKIAG